VAGASGRMTHLAQVGYRCECVQVVQCRLGWGRKRWRVAPDGIGWGGAGPGSWGEATIATTIIIIPLSSISISIIMSMSCISSSIVIILIITIILIIKTLTQGELLLHAPLNQAGRLVGSPMSLCVGRRPGSLSTLGPLAWRPGSLVRRLGHWLLANAPHWCMSVGGPSSAVGPLMTATAPTRCAKGVG